jgi:ribonucleotide reductase alpha subunit
MWLKGGEFFMDEQELLDMFIQERIDMLLTKLSKMRHKKSAEEQKRILQTEYFINSLPDKNRELIQEYIERFSDCLATEEPYLYQQGFMDGVRVLNLLGKL